MLVGRVQKLNTELKVILASVCDVNTGVHGIKRAATLRIDKVDRNFLRSRRSSQIGLAVITAVSTLCATQTDQPLRSSRSCPSSWTSEPGWSSASLRTNCDERSVEVR